MTQVIDLGKLRFSFAGEWSSSTTYETNDVVKYGGNVYVYTYGLKTSTHLPTDTVYWALMVEGMKFLGVYAPATAYHIGDAVAHGGKVYIAVADTTGHTPPNLTYWSQYADGVQYEGDYSGSAQYQKNDLVKYGSSAYIAKQDSTGNLPTNETFWAKLVEGVSAAGAWSAVTAYVPNDLVAYGANQYKSIANNTNQLPISAAGVLNSAYWALQTEGIRSRGEWATATEYYINDVVSHGGNSYICVVRNASTTFDTDLAATKWTKFNGGIRWRSAWATGTSYFKDDVVKDAVGSAYIATQDHTAGADFSAERTAGKWTLFVLGGADVLPAIQTGDAGQSLTVKGDGSGIDWIGATESANVYYVAPHGVDGPDYGQNLAAPFASIRYACDNAPAGSTIFVKTGTYSEQLPITIPANTAIVGDNQRTVVVQPKAGLSDDGVTPNANASMFLMSNGSILNKMTFKGMTGWVPGTTAADVTTSTIKGVVVRLNPASPILTKSPYVLECAFIGVGAIGALIDGSVHSTGAKTMIFHGYTVITDNGVGYWVKDGGKSEIVSCFTYYAYFGYTASGGGFIRALNGNNSYGTWGATSRGFDAGETPLVGELVGRQINFVYSGGNINVGDTVTSSSGGTATVINVQYSANKLYVKNATGTFIAGNTLTFTSGGTGGVNPGGIEDQKGFVLVAKGFSSLPKPGSSIQLTGDTYAYVIQSLTGTYVDSTSELVFVLSQEKPTGSPSGTVATIRTKYSQIRLTGHDFLSIGTGGVSTTNYPGTPTQPSAQGNETDEAYPGRVYYVSTDQDGNFRVGEYFRIDQATGRATLNANAFDLAGLTSLRLGSIGAQLGETINEFSSDATLADNSNVAVPTEYAVKTYVTNLIATTRAYVDSSIAAVAGSLNAVLGDAYAFKLNTSEVFQNRQYRAAFSSGGGSFAWSLTGTPPAGMTISQAGVLSNGNAVITAGNYAFNVVVTSGSVTASRAITILSDAAVPLFSTTAFPATITPSVGYTINAATATVGSGTIVYSVASGSLPAGMSLNTSTGVLSGTAGASSTTPIPYSFTIAAVANGHTATKAFSGTFYYIVIQGQTLYGTNVGPGTYSWVAPTGVTSVNVVAVGAGGWGGYSWSSGGAGGGGLGWKNNIAVTPGQSYTVQVGSYGTQPSNSSTSSGGTPAFFVNTSTVAGYAGGTGGPNAYGTGSAYGGGWVGDGGGIGGTGGSGSWTGGGGGAAGYAGKGGDTQNGAGAGGGGAAAQSQYSSTWGTGGGGGVGLLGQGTSGASSAGYNPWSTGYSGSGGQGGSGGADGQWGELPWSNGNCRGGDYGGGGGGSGSSTGQNYPNTYQQRGGASGVRIIWGPGRAFPATNTADVTASGI